MDGDTRGDARGRIEADVGPNEARVAGAVEEALARALVLAAETGQWGVVAQLARELEARRRRMR